MRSIFFKDLSLYFFSPMFYVVAGIFLFISGIYFFNDVVYVSLLASKIARNQAQAATAGAILKPVFSDLSTLVILLAPLISMRLYSEEKASGTIELLLTYPVSDLKILLGKYLAGMSVFTAILFLTASFMAVLSAFTSPDWGVVIASYLGLLLLGGAVLSMGIFASSLTRNQIIAALFTVALALFFRTIGWFSAFFPGSAAGSMLDELSLVGHLDSFLAGVVSIKHAAFFLSLICFFLALTSVAVASMRRKGHM